MTKYTNNTGISLPLAVWLATDEYDGKASTNPYMISATSLLKSPRQIILGMRADPSKESIDISGLVQSNIGKAIHTAIETAWSDKNRLVKTLLSLEYPEDAVKNLVINPKESELTPDSFPIYMEQREYKNIGKWTITGKYDFIFNGRLIDFKSTGTFTYSNNTKSDDYIKQGSIYRWLNPTKITDDTMAIDFIFTDWKKNAISQNNYPPARTVNQIYPLMSFHETENWIKDKLSLIESLELTDEDQLPHCTDNELWRSESVFKYYSSGKVTARSTKNFDNYSDALAFKGTNAIGLILEIKGSPTACLYCNVANSCTQKNAYIHSGELVI